MKNVGRFEKVSFTEFKRTFKLLYPKYNSERLDMEVEMWYNEIVIPHRATNKSAGYDFHSPFDFTLSPGCQVAVPTGIRFIQEKEDWNLIMMPKSRNVKSSIRMSNTLGLIDGDYSNAENEGHIIIFLEMPLNYMDGLPSTPIFGSRTEKTRKPIHYVMGQPFIQGIFVEIGTIVGDELVEKAEREGGFGSTDDGDGTDFNTDISNDDTTENG